MTPPLTVVSHADGDDEQSPESARQYLSATTAGRVTGTSRQTILRHLSSGTIRGEKDDKGRWRIPVDALIEAGLTVNMSDEDEAPEETDEAATEPAVMGGSTATQTDESGAPEAASGGGVEPQDDVRFIELRERTAAAVREAELRADKRVAEATADLRVSVIEERALGHDRVAELRLELERAQGRLAAEKARADAAEARAELAREYAEQMHEALLRAQIVQAAITARPEPLEGDDPGTEDADVVEPAAADAVASTTAATSAPAGDEQRTRAGAWGRLKGWLSGS